MADNETHLIVGAGFAGAKAAEALRSEGFDGRIVLLGSEPEVPYERPPLSKDYLRGESPREDTHVHPDGFYEEHRIELRTSEEVTEIDTGARQVELAGGERLDWDRLLIATGAEPRRLDLPGSDLEGVNYLRDLADSDRLAAGLERGGRWVVIGAGWIGAEVAASARQKGLEVEIVERAKVPLEHVLGTEVGEIYAAIHRDHGVVLHTEAALEAFEGDGRVERVRLGDGRTIDCDLVVVGVGVAPRVALAEAAGIEVENGILTDERLETSVPGVFAAGDVANAFHPVLRPPAAGRALGQRAQARRDRRADDARQTRRRRPFALLLLRPVRRRNGVFGVRDRVGRGRLPRRSRRWRVHRILAQRRTGRRRDERQRLGRRRSDRGADPLPQADRGGSASRPRDPARRP